MNIKIGEEMKKKRLEKGLTQKEVAKNICTQATISNLENGGKIPTISILFKLADRLNIEFNTIYDYTVGNDEVYDQLFEEVEELCSKVEHRKAYELLKSNIEFEKIETLYEMRLYYYFIGITGLMAQESPMNAVFYFNQVLASESDRNLDILDVLAINSIGIAYALQDEEGKALTYFEKSLEQLDELFSVTGTTSASPEIAKIYYNSAKFHSEIGEYNKAVNLCNLGIALLKKEGLTYYLDLLLYEKAFNLMKLGNKDESEKFYLYAIVTADLNDNEFAVETIKSDIIKYGIGEYKYY